MRLHLKITLWIVVIFLSVGGISIYALLVFQRTAGLQQFESMAHALTEAILHSLTTTMVNNNPTEMREIIRNIEQAPMIERVAIYASDNRVWASSDPTEVGTVRPSALLAQVIATGAPQTEELPAANQLVVLTPIQNHQACQSCHPAGRRILGATVVSLHTEPVEAHLRSSARLLTGLVGFTFLLALGTLSVLLGRVVLEPLSEIVNTVREVSRGNYGARASVQTSDELGVLADAFNDMSGRIQRSTSALSRRIEDLTRRLSTLTIFSRTLAEAGTFTAAMTEAAGAFAEMVGAEACAIYHLTAGPLELLGSAGDASLLSVCGPATVARATAAPGAETSPADCAALGVPLRMGDRVLGAIVVLRRERIPFEPADLALLETVAGHLATAIENRRLFLELIDKERLRGELLSKLIHAHEDERARIARELHDEVSQSLTGVMMGLTALEEEGTIDPARLRGALQAIRGVAEDTLEEVRKVVFDLRPTLLDDLGLIPAVRHYAKTLLEAQGMDVRFHAAGFGRQRLPSAVETTVFRVAQEAITNVARHSRARTVAIALQVTDGIVRLEVNDDGVGFDAGAFLHAPDRRRLGIAGMQERVELLGGTLDITSASGTGTRIVMAVPVSVTRGEAA